MKKELCELTNYEMMELDGGRSVVAESAMSYTDGIGGIGIGETIFNLLLGRLIWTPAYIKLKELQESIKGIGHA